MSARIGPFALALAAPLAFGVGQQTSPTKIEDSSPPAKVDSQSGRLRVRLGGVFIGSGYSRYSGYLLSPTIRDFGGGDPTSSTRSCSGLFRRASRRVLFIDPIWAK
jgi:hypothetical protein